MLKSMYFALSLTLTRYLPRTYRQPQGQFTDNPHVSQITG